MKNSNTSRVLPLALLVCAATSVVAAPAPVTSLTGGDTEIKRIERLIEVRNKVQIDMQNQLTIMAGEINELRGLIEKNSYELQQMLDRQRDLYKEIDTLRQQKSASSVSSTPTSSVHSRVQSENTQYQAAVDLILKEKNYAGAMKAFDEFIEVYPNSVYAPNVYYWLGQLNLSKGNMELAKAHFARVVRFEGSNKRADALLKLGMIASEQKDTAGADKFYRQVIAQFPSSTSASQAKKLLKK